MEPAADLTTREFNLFSMQQDPTYVRQLLSFQVARDLGLVKGNSKPRHVDLILNETHLGLFLLTPKVNRRLLKYSRASSSTDVSSLIFKVTPAKDLSNFNKGEIRQIYPKNFRFETDRAFIVKDLFSKVAAAIRKPAEVRQLFEGFDRQQAVEYYLYSLLIGSKFKSDFFLARNLDTQKSGRFSFIPEFKEFGFGLGKRKELHSWDHTNESILFQVFNADPDFRKSVRSLWTKLRRNEWTQKNLENKINSLLPSEAQAQSDQFIWDLYQPDSSGEVTALTHRQNIDYLKYWIGKRLLFLDKHLSGSEYLSGRHHDKQHVL